MDTYDRRQVMKLSLPGFLGIALSLPSLIASATRANACLGRIPSEATINWDAFLSLIEKEAAQQHLDHWNEETYLKQASAIASRLNLNDPHLLAVFNRYKEGPGIGNGRIDFGKLERQKNFEISFLQFEKGEVIPHHDHPSMTGLLLCAAGKIKTENYSLIGKREQKDSYLLKHSNTTVLEKGKIATLTSKERNIHRVSANELAQIIDIFAPPYNKQRAADSSYFTVDEEIFQGQAGIYEATVKSP